jgi:YVTN family beta-propeller protein
MRLQLTALFDGHAARALLLSGLLLSTGLPLGCSTDTTDDKPPVGARIYATVSSTNEVLVLDEQTHALVKSIGVGRGPAIVLSTPDDAQLYTANWADNTVSVVDLATSQVTSLGMPGRPYVIAMAASGSEVFVGCDGVNAIEVIDTKTKAVVRRLPFSSLPASVIVSPDGRTVYVATLGLPGVAPGKLVAISAETGDIVREALTVGDAPAWITITPDGSKVYTLNFLSDDITVVNTQTWKVDATITTAKGSQGIIGNVTPDGSRLYVTNHGTNDMIAVDTRTNEVVQTIQFEAKPVGVSFNRAGTQVYVTDFGPDSKNQSVGEGVNYLLTGVYMGTGNGQVRVYNVASGAQVGSTVSTGPGPTSVVALPAAKED